MSEDLQRDLEALKKDLLKFRDHMNDTLKDAGTYSHDRVLETRDRLQKAAKEFQGAAFKKIEYANDAVQEQVNKSVETSRESIARKPLTAVMISFGTGILASLLMRKKQK